MREAVEDVHENTLQTFSSCTLCEVTLESLRYFKCGEVCKMCELATIRVNKVVFTINKHGMKQNAG